MKIKIPNGLLIIDILSVALVVVEAFIPSNVVRIILGLPFLLLFPGYALLSAIFVRQEKADNLEWIALCVVLSIAIVALGGFALNFTTLGIRLEPVLACITIFILLASIVALIRRALVHSIDLTTEFKLRLPVWHGSPVNKAVSIVLIAAVLTAVGALGYLIAVPQTGEAFTEFYILGLNGQARDYPAEFTLKNNQVFSIKYGSGAIESQSDSGSVILGIVNRENRTAFYNVALKIDGEAARIHSAGSAIDRLGPIELKPGEKWEQPIGFTPQHIGDNQKVEFILFMDNASTPENTLQLLVNVDPAR